MFSWTVLIVAVVAALPPQQTKPPATSQPSPTTRRSSLRKPPDAELLGRLLREKQATTPILPVAPRNPIGGAAARAARKQRAQGLLLEGVMLIQRSGRLIRDGKSSQFEFDALGTGGKLQRMQILPNQFREQMERQADMGSKYFTISAEVMLYGGKNYLLLKWQYAVASRGNIQP